MEDWDFEEVMVETDVRGYLYEPQYSDEQLRAMEEQEAAEAAAATAEADDLPAAERSPQWLELGGLVVPVLSLCANGHRTRVCLLPRIPAGPISSGRNHGIRGCHGHVCHPSFAPQALRLICWVLDTYFRTQKVYWKRQPKPAGRNRHLSIE